MTIESLTSEAKKSFNSKAKHSMALKPENTAGQERQESSNKNDRMISSDTVKAAIPISLLAIANKYSPIQTSTSKS